MIKVTGRVASGLGNASRNLKSIEKRVAALLGVPSIAEGTLNVLIDKEYSQLDNGIYDECIDAKDYNGREFVKIKRCKLNGFRCVIVRPFDHFHVYKFKRRIEVMSSERLRDKYNLADNDTVSLEFQGDDNWWSSDWSARCRECLSSLSPSV